MFAATARGKNVFFVVEKMTKATTEKLTVLLFCLSPHKKTFFHLKQFFFFVQKKNKEKIQRRKNDDDASNNYAVSSILSECLRKERERERKRNKKKWDRGSSNYAVECFS